MAWTYDYLEYWCPVCKEMVRTRIETEVSHVFYSGVEIGIYILCQKCGRTLEIGATIVEVLGRPVSEREEA